MKKVCFLIFFLTLKHEPLFYGISKIKAIDKTIRYSLYFSRDIIAP
jgi:hypothetical protein